jgi:hypothetical protein
MSYDGYRVQVTGQAQVYVVLNNQSCWIPDPTTYKNLWGTNTNITQLTQALFDGIPSGTPLTSGAILARGNGTAAIYLITWNQKLWVSSPETMDKYDFESGTLNDVPTILLSSITSGPNIT